MNIESNTFLAVRALFNTMNTSGTSVDEIYADILNTWLPATLEQVAKLVPELSDIQVKITDGENTEPATDPEPAKK